MNKILFTILFLFFSNYSTYALTTISFDSASYFVQKGQQINVIVKADSPALNNLALRVYFDDTLVDFVASSGVTSASRVTGGFIELQDNGNYVAFLSTTMLSDPAITAGTTEIFHFSLIGIATGNFTLTVSNLSANDVNDVIEPTGTLPTSVFSVYQQPSAIIFSSTSGTYNTAQTLSLSSVNSQKIFYTLDGITPNSNSTLYSAPFSLDANDGVTVLVNAIAYSVAGNYTLTNGSLLGNASYTFDKKKPNILNVNSISSDISYKSGDIIELTIKFDEIVYVIGTPTLTLETGSVDAIVTYSSGSGLDTLTFSYTVANGENSLDLEYVNINSLTLNSANIKDLVGNDANITLPIIGSGNSLSDNRNIIIDTTSPTCTSIATTATSTFTGSTLDFSIVFSESVTGFTDYASDISITSTGSLIFGTATISQVNTSSYTLNLPSVTGEGDLTISVVSGSNILDSANNPLSSSVSSSLLSIDNNPPTSYSASFSTSYINSANNTSIPFSFNSAELGSTYTYSIDDLNALTNPIVGTGTITSSSEQISNLNLNTLDDGTITLTVALTDSSGNVGADSASSILKDTLAPSSYSINILNTSSDLDFQFQFSNTEPGGTYNFTIIDDNASTSDITGSGNIINSNDTVTGIDISSLSDGFITLTVSVSDPAENFGNDVSSVFWKKVFSYLKGWNLFSLPGLPFAVGGVDVSSLTNTFSNIFPNHLGKVWAWDATTQGYLPITDITEKQGWWIYFEQNGSSVVTLGNLANSTFSENDILNTSWHLLGVTDNNIYPNIIFSKKYNIWEWNNKYYIKHLDYIPFDIFKGYWIESKN